MTEAYPLHWPEGRPRTARRERSRFDTTHQLAQTRLMEELRLMNAKHVVLSTNVELRRDGLPYSSRKNPDDPGVAVYFEHKGRSVCFACDRWDSVGDNIQAIKKTVEALRGIARWGTGDMMEAAFSGFVALPAPSWRGDLGLGSDATLSDAEASYRSRARYAHPDAGGSEEAMSRLNVAITAARKELK